MTKKNNKTCICCGTKYTYCNRCEEFDKYPIWMTLYHDENCKEIFMTAADYLAKDISKEEAKAKLEKCDLSAKDTFNKKVLEVINTVCVEKKSPKKTTKIEESVEEKIETDKE